MTTVTETITHTDCDICQERDIEGRKKQIIIKDKVYDLCHECFMWFRAVTEFLETAGTEIDYRLRGGKDA